MVCGKITYRNLFSLHSVISDQWWAMFDPEYLHSTYFDKLISPAAMLMICSNVWVPLRNVNVFSQMNVCFGKTWQCHFVCFNGLLSMKMMTIKHTPSTSPLSPPSSVLTEQDGTDRNFVAEPTIFGDGNLVCKGITFSTMSLSVWHCWNISILPLINCW